MQKRPKLFPNCPNVFWTCFGVIFSKHFFCPVLHGGSSFRNVFKKSRNIQNSKNAQNRSQNCPNLFWTIFEVIFSRNFFAQCSREGRVSEMFSKNLEIFKNPKMPRIVPKSVQTCFELVLGYFLRKFLFAPCSMEGGVFEILSKSQKSFKTPKTLKNVPKLSKSVLNKFWGTFLGNFSCPVFQGGSSLRNVFKKSRNIQNSKNAQNRSQNCPNLFWTIFEVIFSRNFFAQCSREGRVFEMFSKNLETFKIPKTPKIVPKSVQIVLNDI